MREVWLPRQLLGLGSFAEAGAWSGIFYRGLQLTAHGGVRMLWVFLVCFIYSFYSFTSLFSSLISHFVIGSVGGGIWDGSEATL